MCWWAPSILIIGGIALQDKYRRFWAVLVQVIGFNGDMPKNTGVVRIPMRNSKPLAEVFHEEYCITSFVIHHLVDQVSGH